MSPCNDAAVPDSSTSERLIPRRLSSTAADIGLVRNPEIDYPAKYRGTLLAGAIGDALGRPAEGMRPFDIQARYGALLDFQPWRGWRNGPTGTITDDTQLTMLLADSIITNGCLDPGDIAARLVAWLPHGRGKGRATTEAVLRLQAGTPWFEAGTPSAGNGAAMRVAPIGLLHPLDVDDLRTDAAVSAVVTHADPMAVVSTVAQAFSVAFLLHRTPGCLDVDDYFESLELVLADLHDPGAPERRTSAGPDPVRLADRLAEVRDMLDLTPEQAFDRLWNGAFVLESLPAALWTFLKTPDDPEQVIVTAVNRGHDADTVAAMAGNLAGAYMGAGSLPGRWLDDLEFADELCVEADGLLRLADLT
ncbi:ADP-ribosyl-[dinitrogen reductase] glycohydrolase [bacterium BMS3Bbin01]|nr:ADP-ribosyl-[dinitrogen reductase] glycohydrolase [bacterium BMS3Bbin01]